MQSASCVWNWCWVCKHTMVYESISLPVPTVPRALMFVYCLPVPRHADASHQTLSFYLMDNVGNLNGDQEAVRTCFCVKVWFLYREQKGGAWFSNSCILHAVTNNVKLLVYFYMSQREEVWLSVGKHCVVFAHAWTKLMHILRFNFRMSNDEISFCTSKTKEECEQKLNCTLYALFV